jgi:hypothetical protein
MAATIEHVLVYEVQMNHSNCTQTCPRVCERSWLHADETFLYDEWAEAAARIKAFFDGRLRGCQGIVMVDLDTMPKAEFDALPADDAPADA